MGVIVQPVSISFYQFMDNHESGLLYQPLPVLSDFVNLSPEIPGVNNTLKSPLTGNPEPKYRSIANWDRLQKKVEHIYYKAKLLIEGHSYNPNSNSEFCRETAMLSNEVIPESGLLDIFTPGTHPQLITINDFAAQIPWEAIHDQYKVCPQCHRSIRVFGCKSPQIYCDRCAVQLQHVTIRLSTNYQLSHLVHGQQPCLTESNEFLIIEDPSQDLCDKENDPNGICKKHLKVISQTLSRKGFNITRFAGPMATADNIINQLDKGVAGLYYFGHGLYDRHKNQGCLSLADGLIYASEIAKIGPVVPFVFLNGCYSAMPGNDWVVEKKPTSVAECFSRKAKVTIASTFPVLNVHAAEFAKTVFTNALNGHSLGQSVNEARMVSLKDFEGNKSPDICWMAYRFLGKPNSKLTIPDNSNTITVEPQKYTTRHLFNDEGELKTEYFGFEIENVFARAGRRRAWQRRKLVTILDLVAGLFRKGDFTRTVIRLNGGNPDKFYERALRYQEYDPKDVSLPTSQSCMKPEQPEEPAALEDIFKYNEEAIRNILEHSTIRNKSECTVDFIDVLQKAYVFAQHDSENNSNLIMERHILETLLDLGKWPVNKIDDLPTLLSMKECIQDILLEPLIDDNGLIRFNELDMDSMKIIERAHLLSQQLGVCSIPNRILLASFLSSENSYTSCLLEDYGQDPKIHFDALVKSIKKEPPCSFNLSLEACERAILPVLRNCLDNISDGQQITEKQFFTSFCEQAPEALKDSLINHVFPLDLNYLKRINPIPSIIVKNNFTEATWRMLCRSMEVALKQGSQRIRSHHLMSALLIDAHDLLEKYFKSHSMPLSEIEQYFSLDLSENVTEVSRVDLRPSFNVKMILSRSLRVSKELKNKNEVDIEDVLYASLSDWDFTISSLKGIRG